MALSGQTLCYYHARTGRLHRSIVPQPDPIPTVIHPLTLDDGMQRAPVHATPPAPPLQLDLPPLEDRESIQLALSMIISAMAQNRIETKRATSMVYALQVASSNARSLNLQPSRSSIVTETVLDADGQQIAPDEDPESEIAAQQLLALIDREEAEAAEELAEELAEQQREKQQDEDWEREKAARIAAAKEDRARIQAQLGQLSQSQHQSQPSFQPGPATNLSPG
jgi:hypothetical protein